ncbi:MAG: hypothetical protein ACI3XR_05170 [Eubacteriales bacterium]
MKRKASLMLAALMIVSMTATLASCGGDTPETTTGSDTTTTTSSVTTTSSATTTSNVVADPSTPTSGGLLPTGDTPLVEADSEYAYKVFYCPYSASGPNGTYDETQDELVEYMSGFGWTMGDDTIPDAAMDDIKSWTDKANGPFGDCNVSGYGYTNADIGWTDQNHGLMLYTTFTIDNLEEFKNAYEDLYMVMWYDNTPSIYINGTLIFYKNTNLTGDPKDWTDGDTFKDVWPEDEEGYLTDATQDMLSLLVEGENTVVIILKDAWGGRECCFELGATPDAIFHD